MLFYHPAFDAYHCLFRLLIVLEGISSNEIEKDRLRIFDFYMLFPSEIANISNLPQLVTKARAKFGKIKQYEEISNPSNVFYQLEEIFQNSVTALKQFGLIEIRSGEKITYNRGKLAGAFWERVNERKAQHAEAIEFMASVLQSIPLNGPDGLKQKTHLLPYRYERK